MEDNEKLSFFQRLKALFIGKARDLNDPKLFQHISLIAFFAWVGLGADGLSSCCYGPEEAFLALKGHTYLGIFVALASAITIFVISSSYSQIIELFPAGGGGYLVASKLLSPSLGMISGCALLIDYVLTITISVASGADALFSFLPSGWYQYKLFFAAFGVLAITMLNLRGVKESVLPLVPIFVVFLLTHIFAIIYGLTMNVSNIGAVAGNTVFEMKNTISEVGIFGMFLMIMRAYSMGAGTYTGIEAVSNGMPVLREPRVQTAKKTMRYMSLSLAFVVVGLMLGYLFYNVQFVQGKTLNAVLLENLTKSWNQPYGYIFILITLLSEAILLFVAAQAGFLDGPRVLANMAQDRWFPSKFAILSERLVTENGILLMGGAALILMIFSRGSVKFLVVLYAINVFITFFLSQLGMVRHWWKVKERAKKWRKKIFINGFGLILTAFILVSVLIIKFNEGGWITIFITGALILLAISIKRHYKKTIISLKNLENLVVIAEEENKKSIIKKPNGTSDVKKPDAGTRTAVILVNGYNGLGLHTVLSIMKLFKENFKNFIFIQVGMIDAGNFKGTAEMERLETKVEQDLNRYVKFMHNQGYYSEGYSAIGTDIVEEISPIASKIFENYPNSVFFGSQVVFPKDTFFTKMLHNYTTFAVQRDLYHKGIPFLIMPIRVTG